MVQLAVDLLQITLRIDPLTIHGLFNLLTTFTIRNHLASSSPPETTLLLMDYSTPQITVHLQPLKALLMHYLLCCSVPVYTLGINISILVLNVNCHWYLASTFPKSPTA